MDRHLCVVTYEDDEEIPRHREMDSAQQRTVEHCLQVAASKFHEDGDNIAAVKAALEAGRTVPMWAPGPGGVAAATGLLEEFHRYEADARKLLSVLEGEDTCRWCGRSIVNEGGRWVDPEATGDDSVWRETCEAHDTFTAEHEPEGAGT